jgi:hypothetical protein
MVPQQDSACPRDLIASLGLPALIRYGRRG